MTLRRCSARGCTARIRPPANRCARHARAQRRARRHPGYDSPAYRRARAMKIGAACERCGQYDASSVHHLDGDPSNDAPENLQGVCSACKPLADDEMRRNRS